MGGNRQDLVTFKYREYAENFSKKIKKAIKSLNPFAEGYEKSGYEINGLLDTNPLEKK